VFALRQRRTSHSMDGRGRRSSDTRRVIGNQTTKFPKIQQRSFFSAALRNLLGNHRPIGRLGKIRKVRKDSSARWAKRRTAPACLSEGGG